MIRVPMRQEGEMTTSSRSGSLAVLTGDRDAPIAGLAVAQDHELELKLDLSPSDADRLGASEFFLGCEEQAQESTYYDTVTDMLRRSGLSLRVRQTGQRYVQTIKVAGVAAAGLFARSEWERKVAGDQPIVDETVPPLAALLASSDRLEPCFRVEVARRTALVDRHGGSVELVLDRGLILASGQSEPVCEIELELKAGDPAALFATAREIDALMPLRLGVLTKSERGYRLREVDRDKAVKAEPIALDKAMSAAAGFQAIVYACLRQFRLNEAILVRTGAADALHQIRVSLRRLRSALSIFKPMLADDDFERIRDELRWITSALGDARNIDVLIDRISEDSLARPLREAREAAYAATREALASARLRALMIDLAEWIATGEWFRAPTDPALRDRPICDFARETLTCYRRRVKRSGHGLAELDDDERHAVRIRAKKLRYSAEFFATLFNGERRNRRRKAFLDALEELQNALGELNDLAVAPALLERLGLAGTAVAAALTAEPDSRDEMVHRSAKAYGALIAAKPFWQ
jgi:triphosphatase